MSQELYKGEKGFQEIDPLIPPDESGRESWRKEMDFKDWDIIYPVGKGKKFILGPPGACVVQMTEA